MAILILCVKIFFVRILDVSLGTFRTLLTVKGKTFSSNVTNVDLFIFDVPDIPEVTECYIRIPFNNNVDIIMIKHKEKNFYLKRLYG